MIEKLSHRLIPAYLDEFKCICGNCEDTCCGGWQIDIDKKMFKTLSIYLLLENMNSY